MSDQDLRALLRDALDELKRARLGAEARREPIAVVGMGCRFPGAEGPGAFWDLLREGRDAVTTVPPDRWDGDLLYDADPAAAGKVSSRFGGFLEEVQGFDARLFGIAPVEAERMDPQQRLLLEVTWHALEHAGVSPDGLSGSQTGVFVGISGSDHAHALLAGGGLDEIDAYFGTGHALSVAAGRLSYLLGLQGPALAVDTSCSSSLVAVHLAVQSLRARECDAALVGGVNLILSPEMSVAFSRARMLAPDGRCKTFDAAADGYARGEGCGVVVLRRLSEARARRERVWATIRGSAVNQDGRSSGLTAPNGPAQVAVIRRALEAAGVAAQQVAYVEAHGTGTPLGDPIELRALARALERERAAAPELLVGSVKTNFGHLEAAAGIAGLIKTVLALHHAQVPAHLHFRTPSPHVPWSTVPLRVPTALTPWPGPRLAGVSSFGFSGTNAHVILEAAAEALDDGAAAETAERPLHLLPLSAQSADALRAQTAAWAGALDGHALADVCFTAGAGRAHLEHRVAVVAANTEAMRGHLERFAAGQTRGLAQGTTEGRPPARVAFLFSGQGAQFAGMGKALYETEPRVRAVLENCDRLLRGRLPRPLLDVIFSAEPDELDRTEFTQPALFAVEWALAELLRSWGVEPALVLGHSLGEYVAACVAGVLPWEDALLLVAERARLMQSLPAGGGMAVVFADEETVGPALAARPEVVVAAVNAPANLVLSGEGVALEAVLSELSARGVASRPLAVSHAFHSPLMEPILDEFERAAARVTCAAPKVPVVSNLTGEVLRGDAGARYWRSHLRERVRFADGVRAARARGCDVFVEIGPGTGLLTMARQCIEGEGTALFLPTLRPGIEPWRPLLHALGSLYVAGAPIDWEGFDGPYRRRRVVMPGYPFARPARVPAGTSTHPLLGTRLPREAGAAFACRSDAAWLAQHRVGGRSLWPAAALLEVARAAAQSVLGAEATVEELTFEQPLPVDGREVQVRLAPPSGGATRIELVSAEGNGWARHVRAVARAKGTIAGASLDLPAVQARCAPFDPEALYARLEASGLVLGPELRRVSALWRRDGEALARVEGAAADGACAVHPALLDACLHVVAAAAPAEGTRIVAGVERFEVLAAAEGTLFSHCTLDGEKADVRVYDDSGRPVAVLGGLTLRRPHVGSDSLYAVAWRPRPLDASDLPPVAAAAEAARAVFTEAEDAHVLYRELLPELEQAARAYAACAAAGLDASHVPPRHRRLHARVCELARGVSPTPPALDELRARFAAAGAELDLLERAGTALGAVLRGERNPLDVLFPGGDTGPVERLYAEAPFARVYNRAVAEAVAALSAGLSPARRLRVLEVGAGTGGTTAQLLARLPADRTDYLFTDVSPQFLAQAARKLAAWPSLRYQTLDLEDEGAVVSRHDVVVAVNVVHATRSLSRSLHHLRRLLAPAGVLVLVEGTDALAWVDLVFGLTEGWWRFDDAPVRTGHPLVSREQWAALLGQAGLGDVNVLPAAPAGNEGLWPQSVLLARAPVTQAPARRFTVVGGGQKGRALAESLRARGAACEEGEDGGVRVADGADVVYFADAQTPAKGALALLQAVAGAAAPARAWLVTLNAQPAAPGGTPSVAQAAVWGLGRVFAAEHPDRWGGLVDLDEAAAAAELAGHLVADDREDQVAFREGVRYAARLARVEAGAAPPLRFSGDATYLVTGGTGGVGRRLARWLVERGARHLVLSGRRSPDERVQQDMAQLEAAGCAVRMLRTDLADPREVQALVAAIDASGPPLRGIVHAAGVFDDALVAHAEWEQFRRVLAPKADGAWHLHEALGERPLDFFVLFSSAVAVLGPPGLANYAAANASLDALAAHRRARGLPALSVGWGPWSGTGMAETVGARLGAQWSSAGIETLAPADALALLERVWTHEHVLVAPVRWSRWLAGRAVPPLLAECAVETATAPVEARSALRERIGAARPGARRALLVEHVRAEAARALGFAQGEEVPLRTPLGELGLDSLMALNLTRALSTALGTPLASTLVFNHPTVERLADHLAPLVAAEAATAPAAAAVVVPGDEPIAIVGMACRFPGASDPKAFWRLLADGVDAVREVPPERWRADAWYDADPSAPGRMNTRWGAFVEEVDRFDATLFGISPREAARMDPQHRLLLEVGWAALEDAGQAPDGLSGSDSGVFVGIYNNDYGKLLDDPSRVDAHLTTGNAGSIAAGRLSYLLGLAGPAVAVDTACSSSLMAVHLAAQSLRAGECSLALAGGVNLMLSPLSTLAVSQLGMMAPDGRCKTFDAAADGFVRGEGCGLVVLKRLSRARADGDRVLALLRASAANHDGRSSGLTAPSGPAQEAVIRRALAAAGGMPADVDYVEAHGTGTALGDPIELQALDAVLGAGRAADRPLRVGSVKTNIGHLEAAAGVAGLIKVLLALRHEQMPPHLHFRRPTPNVAWDRLSLRVTTRAEPWRAGARLAGVSSFGFSGTNVHVLVGEAPAPEPVPDGSVDRPVHLLALSARNEASLRALAGRWLHLETDERLADLCFSANTGRARLPHRLAVVAATLADAQAQLAAYIDGRPGPAHGRVDAGRRGGVLFGFGPSLDLSGASDLASTCPPLAAVLRTLREDEPCSPSALCATQVALAELWQGWGVLPSAVRGEGEGARAAAQVAGERWPVVEEGDPALWIGPELRWTSLLEALARLFVTGVDPDWAAFDAPYARRKVDVPTYPFARERHWLPEGPPAAPAAPVHPLLGPRLRSALSDTQYETVLRARTPAYLADHRVWGHVVVPAAALLEMALAAARATVAGDAIALEEVTIEQALVLTEDEERPVQTLLARDGSFRILSLPSGGHEWTLHASGRLAAPGVPPPPLDADAARARCPSPLVGEDFYRGTGVVGFQFGPAFRGLIELHRGEREVLARVERPDTVETAGYLIHPAFLDACLQAFGAALAAEPLLPAPYVPVRLEAVRRFGTGSDLAWSHARVREGGGPETFVVDVTIYDEGGRAWAVVDGLHVKRAERGALERLAGRGATGGTFRVDWVSRALPRTAALSGRFALLDGDGAAEALAARITEAGGTPVILGPETGATVPEDCAHVVSLRPLEPAGVAVADATGLLMETVRLVQALAARPVPPRLWLVTRGALPAGGAPSLVQAPLTGLARVVSLEHPELRCTLVDLDPAATDLQAVVDELGADDGEEQVARRANDRLVGRLVRHRAGSAAPLTLRPDAFYVVTGGFGALGLEVARWLAARGARRLALVSRGGPSAQARAALDELRGAGATVVDARADVTRGEELARAVAPLDAPLAGVVHTAGALGDAALVRLLPHQLEEAMAAKALGAYNLHQLTATLSLDFFVLFSSATALLGRPGQGAYAAANAFVDALAHHRRARGLPALAVNWGPWASGMAAGATLPDGLHALGVSDALAALEGLLAEGVPQAAVVAADWMRFARPGAGRIPSLLHALVGPRSSGEGADAGALRRRLDAAPPAHRPALLRDHVLAQVRAILQMDASQPLDTRQPLSELGFDSLMTVELSRALGQALQRPLPATLLFQHPTVEALVEHLVAEPRAADAAGTDATGDAAEDVDDAALRREVVALDEAQLDEILADFAGTD